MTDKTYEAVEQLVTELEKRHLTEAEADRVREHLEADIVEDDVDPDAMDYNELRSFLAEKDLDAQGDEEELRERAHEYLRERE